MVRFGNRSRLCKRKRPLSIETCELRVMLTASNDGFLDLNGGYAEVASNQALNFADSDFTLETSFTRRGNGQDANEPLVSKDGRYFLTIRSGTLQFAIVGDTNNNVGIWYDTKLQIFSDVRYDVTLAYTQGQNAKVELHVEHGTTSFHDTIDASETGVQNGQTRHYVPNTLGGDLNENLVIGSRARVVMQNFVGDIHEVRLWSKAVDCSHLDDPFDANEDGLVQAWEFNQDDDANATLGVKSGMSASLVGAVDVVPINGDAGDTNSTSNSFVELNGGYLVVTDSADSALALTESNDFAIEVEFSKESASLCEGPCIEQLVNKEESYTIAIRNGTLQWALYGTSGVWTLYDSGYTVPTNGTTTRARLEFSRPDSTSYGEFFVNGESMGEVNSTDFDSANGRRFVPDSLLSNHRNDDLKIGTRSLADTQKFKGKIHDVAIWDGGTLLGRLNIEETDGVASAAFGDWSVSTMDNVRLKPGTEAATDVRGSQRERVGDVCVSDRQPGDVDGNGSVDFADFLVLSDNFGQEVDKAWADGDFDGNGVVDFTDFLALSVNFGTT